MFVIALLSMLCIGLAHHLGLVEAIAEVMEKIAGCVKCSTRWGTLIVLLCFSCDLWVAIVLSVLMAYLSYYYDMILAMLDQLYKWLWERINKIRE